MTRKLKYDSLGKARILIVDDFSQFRLTLKSMLFKLGTRQVDQAINGAEAIKLCSENDYDIIFCDYNFGDGQDGMLLIQIDDDGSGYPQKLLDAVDDFSSGINAQTGSTGLGLYFAATIADSHQRHVRQGHIRVQNAVALSGGSFQLFLP